MKRKLLSLAVALLCTVATFADTDCTSSVSTTGWKKTDGTTAAGETGSWAMGHVTVGANSDVPMYENYANTNTKTTGVMLQQTISGLANGTYTVELYANSIHANGVELGDGITAYTDARVYVFANNQTVPVTVEEVNTKAVSSYYTIRNVKVTDGTLHLGLRKNVGGTNWQTIQIKSLTLISNPLTTYGSLVGNATKDSPVDATFFIQNNSFETSGNGGWTYELSEDTGIKTSTGDYVTSGIDGGYLFNTWWQGKPITQTISNLPNGGYTLKVALAGSNADGDAKLFLLAQGNHSNLITITRGTSGTFNDYTYNFTVTNGSATIGVVGGNDDGTYNANGHWWYKADNFRLTYYGNAVEAYSPLSFTSGTSVTANTWYAFTVPSAGRYKISSEGETTIKYTQNASADADADVTSFNLSASGSTCLTLSSGTFYFKSSLGTNPITITACTYTVNAATSPSIANDSYYNTKTLSSFTVSISGSTDDTGASLAVIGSPVATLEKNGVSVATSSTLTWSDGTLTAAFSDVALEAGSSDYNISIPAGSFGYDGHATNAAISIDFNTPVVFDGTYYLYDATNKVFLSRGANWGTRTTVDKYGAPFTWSNTTKNITFVDLSSSLFFDQTNHTECWIYSDGTSKGVDGQFAFETTTGGLYLRDDAETAYICHDNSVLTVPSASSTGAAIWTLKNLSEHDDIVNAYPTENKESVITDAEISTTAASFETYLSTNYNAVDKSSLINAISYNNAKGDGWTWNATNRTNEGYPSYNPSPYASLWNNTGYYTYSVDKANLPAGIYKLEMQGFDRRQGRNSEASLYTSYGNIGASYLEANGQKVRIKNAEEMFEAHKSDDSGWTVNREWAGQLSSLDGGYAPNVVYVYLDGNTDLNIKIEKPDFADDCCLVIGGIELTYYDQTEVTMTTSAAGKYGTFIAPFDVTIPSGVSAYTIESHDGARLNLTSVSTTISANTPVVVYNENAAISETFRGKDNSGGETSVKVGYLTGVYTASTVTAGNYVLQTQDGVQGFYKVYGDGLTAIPYRAYLTVPSDVKAFFFDVTDGITEVAEKTEATEVCFDLSGRRIQKPTKGLYIKNGKKVVIK